MKVTTIYKCLPAFLTLFASTCEAKKKGSVTLINATPYNWKLTYAHQYQMDWDFPPFIPAGHAHEQSVGWKKNKDDAAEAVYTIIGAPDPMSFTIQARQHKKAKRNIEIKYNDEMKSLGNDKDSLIDLGWSTYGTVSFVLGGNGTAEEGFDVSSNPPVAWMQATYPVLAEQPLREMVIPASHDAGMYTISKSYGGIAHNTVTQRVSIYEQLHHGVRYFDIRPILRRGTFWTGHFTRALNSVIGGLGASIEEMINDINRFNKEFPGELIILDITHQMNRDAQWKTFSNQEWQLFYEILSRIEDLFQPVDASKLASDYSTINLGDFIQAGGRSNVLVRLPGTAPEPIVGRDKDAISAVRSQLIMMADEPRVCPDTICPGFDPIFDEVTGECSCPKEMVIPSSFEVVSIASASSPETDPEDDDDEEPTPPFADMVSLNAQFEAYEATSIPPTGVPVTCPSAFVSEDGLPFVGAFSNTDSAVYLTKDQLEKLRSSRNYPMNDYPLRSTWTLTQSFHHIIDIATKKHSIIGLAKKAHKALYRELWGQMSKRRYPNIVEIDAISNSAVTALAMAINRVLANPYDGQRIRDVAQSKMMERAVVVEAIDTEVVKEAGEPGSNVIWNGKNIANYWALKWCEWTHKEGQCGGSKKKYLNHRRVLIAEMWVDLVEGELVSSRRHMEVQIKNEVEETNRVKEFWKERRVIRDREAVEEKLEKERREKEERERGEN